jgi:hypothetical protein
MAEALQQDPRLAQALSDMMNGKRGAPASLVRYFGRDLLNAEEGTPEYDEIAAAEKERQAELEAQKASVAEYNKNIDASKAVLDQFAADNKLNLDEFLDKVYNQIIDPIFNGVYTPELLTMLNNAINYDADIESARRAGEVGGRNMKIEQMKGKQGDGMPAIGTGGAQVTPPAPERKKHIAEETSSGSVWDEATRK